jgi:hypothetical protein
MFILELGKPGKLHRAETKESGEQRSIYVDGHLISKPYPPDVADAALAAIADLTRRARLDGLMPA